MSTPGDDAQREMEQRALRNVRGLVDKIENKDELDRRSVRRTAIIIVAVLALLAGGAYVAYLFTAKREPPRTIILPPPAGTPAQK